MTIKLLNRPIATLAASRISRVAGSEKPRRWNRTDAITDARAVIPLIEASIVPVSRTMVNPAVTIPVIEVETRVLITLSTVRKLGAVKAKTTHSKIVAVYSQ